MRSVTITAAPRSRLAATLAIIGAITLAGLPNAHACTICALAGSQTLASQLATSDAAVVVLWVSAQQSDSETESGSATFHVQQIVKAPQRPAKSRTAAPAPAANLAYLRRAQKLATGQSITLNRYVSGQAGDRFLLFGNDQGEGQGLDWGVPLAITENGLNYIVQAPASTAPEVQRLAYYLKHLESPDLMVSDDAYTEFGLAQFENIERLQDQLPREKIRQWIVDPQTPANRLGLYGMMIGLCGNDMDAQNLEQRILIQTSEFRLGVDGLMVGYLLLKKEAGLDILDQHKLQNKLAAFSETFAALQAVRFIGTYAPQRIAQQRLHQSLQMLLERPELTDMVIADLARGKDWSIQDRLMKMYGVGVYNTSSIKLAIVRYLLVSSQDVPEMAGAKLPVHVVNGLKRLNELRMKDPKTVAAAERFFVAP